MISLQIQRSALGRDSAIVLFPKFLKRFASLIVAVTTLASMGTILRAAEAAGEPYDYSQPAHITGTVYGMGTDHKHPLFTFQRNATRTGATVHVERKFIAPDGTIAAVENITYESGRLATLDMKEFQAGLWGSVQIKADPKNHGNSKLSIDHGADKDAKKSPTTDDLTKDTLIDDTLYPFMMAHWDELQHGDAVKFRFISLEWEKTFGFKLTKSGEGSVNGRQIITLRMEPTNPLVAHLMNPIFFSLEKNGSHHLIEYKGRTTPRSKNGKSWKYLDADTVFDWPS